MRPTVVLLLFLVTYLTAFAQASFVQLLDVSQGSESIKVRFSVAEGIEAVEQVVLKFEPVNGESLILPSKTAMVGQSHFLAPGEYSLQWFPAWENRTLPKEGDLVAILEVSYFDDRAMETLRSDNTVVLIPSTALQSQLQTSLPAQSKGPPPPIPPPPPVPSKEAVSSDSTEVADSMESDAESNVGIKVIIEEQADLKLEDLQEETIALDDSSDDSNLESDLSEKAEVIPDIADVADDPDGRDVVDARPETKLEVKADNKPDTIGKGEKQSFKSRLRSLFGGDKKEKELPIVEEKQTESLDADNKPKQEKKKGDQAVYGIYSSKFNN